MLRQFLGSLFGRRPVSADEVVFEPLDGPLDGPPPAAPIPGREIGRSVAVEKIIPRVPPRWLRAGEAPLHEVLVLPEEALLPGKEGTQPRYSLRYLARYYPSTFRDPGVMEPDPGVSLLPEELADPEAGLADPDKGLSVLPPETVQEISGDPATFSEWEGDRPVGEERTREVRETRRALRGVRLPKSESTAAGGFAEQLSRSEARSEAGASQPSALPAASEKPKNSPSPAAPNMRLRRILAAYAETLPEFAGTDGGAPREVISAKASAAPGSAGVENGASAPVPKTAPAPDAANPVSRGPVLGPRSSPGGGASNFKPASEQRPVLADYGTAPGRGDGRSSGEGVGRDSLTVGEGDAWETRFRELSVSLSRFAQVTGFALWEGGRFGHSGSMEFDPGKPGVREGLENLLQGGQRFGGGAGAFLSVTLQHVGGGVSVFGWGACVVAVSHRGADVISEGLRGWLCGWVAQAGAVAGRGDGAR